MELSQQEFVRLSNYIHGLCGIVISSNKSYLIEQRLEPLVADMDCRSFGEFYDKVAQRRQPELEQQIIDAITTNETFFFRDAHPFVTFKEQILPQLGTLVRRRKARDISRKGPTVSLWSAGSSTGQEPYSLAMLIHEYSLANRYLNIYKEDFGLLATDVSSAALSRAMAGEYTEMEMKRGLSADRMAGYFRKNERCWIINSHIREMIEFRQINLVKPFSSLGGFDVILCRNVLIYFDNTTRERMVNQLYDMLSDGGFLLLGATENLYAITDKFESIHHGRTLLYRKPAKETE
ncbi:MAG: protein-glutamate O-methyltransferase CheR [Thermodesulfobacteriota bacterium]|nr:protein-glutamate O-methyltransferase CheR [Thermodesulfobacteriota bacterium]